MAVAKARDILASFRREGANNATTKDFLSLSQADQIEFVFWMLVNHEIDLEDLKQKVLTGLKELTDDVNAMRRIQ